jgi:hypothetical protein
MRSVFLIAFFLFMCFGAFAVTSERYYAPYDTRASDNTRYIAPYDPRLKNENINLDQNQTIAITVYDGNIETLVSLSWTALNAIIPWVDANVSNSLTVDWTGLQNYPVACGAGEFVSTIGDTLTCSIPPGTTTDTNWATEGKDFKELSELWNYFPYKSVGDANIVSVAWSKVTGAPEIPVLVLPWADGNISSSATWNAKLDWSTLNGVIPWQDANLSTDFNKTFVKQSDGNNWYVGNGTFNAAFPVQDANLSTDFNRVFVRQIDGNTWYVFASTFNSAFPIQDANLSTDLNKTFVRQSDGNAWYVLAGIFNSAFPIQDANLSTDLNRVFVRQSDGNVWYYKVNADVNTTGTIKGVQVCVGNDCQTAWPTGINQTSVNYNGATVLRSDYTLANANITFSSAPANGSYIEVTTINLTSGGGTSAAAAVGYSLIFGG